MKSETVDQTLTNQPPSQYTKEREPLARQEATSEHHHHSLKDKLSRSTGTITFRPLEAKFTIDNSLLYKIETYCKFKIGVHREKSSLSDGTGANPTWRNNDVVIKVKKNSEYAKLTVKSLCRCDKGFDGTNVPINTVISGPLANVEMRTFRDKIGCAKIPLESVLTGQPTKEWIPISKKDKVTGEVLVEMFFTPKNE